MEEIEQVLTHLTSMLQTLTGTQLRNKDDPGTSVGGAPSPVKQTAPQASQGAPSPTVTVTSEPESPHHRKSEPRDASKPSEASTSAKDQEEDTRKLRGLQEHTKQEEWMGGLCDSSLYLRLLPTFSNGTVCEYWEFKQDFQRLLRKAKMPEVLKLQTLLGVYSGPAEDNLIECLEIRDPEKGYREAWKILDQRHGDKYTYICHLMKKVLRGPTVQLSDPRGLQQLLNKLENCVVNLRSLGELRQIDTYHSVRNVAERFQGRLWDDYLDESYEYRKKQGKPPRIEWMVEFLRNMVDKAEFVSKLRGEREWHGSSTSPSLHQPPTEGSHVDPKEDKKRCSLCREDHPLHTCQKFLEMTTARRESVIREERRCFACLGRHHRIAECSRKERCCIDGCPGYHSQLLHYTRTRKNNPRAQRQDEMIGIPRTGGAKRTREVHPDDTATEHKWPRLGGFRAAMPSPEPAWNYGMDNQE